MDTQPQQPLIPPPLEEMNKMAIWILETLKNQGLSFLLLGVAVWYFHGESKELRTELMHCMDSNQSELTQAIKENTSEIKTLRYYVEKQEIRTRK